MSGSVTFYVSGCAVVETRSTFAAEVVFDCGSNVGGLLRIESEPSLSELTDQFPRERGSLFEIEVFDTGALRLSGILGLRELVVTPDPDYEAWTLTMNSGELFVSQPGGGLLHWGPRV